MTSSEMKALWERWIDLWNGDLAQAQDIIHIDFGFHRIPPPRISDQLVGRDALVAWIGQTRSPACVSTATTSGGPRAG